MPNIKIRNNAPVTDDVKDYLKKRFAKLEQLLPPNSFIEVEFIDQFGERRGVDKKVEVDLSMPGEKHPLHLENYATDWQTSIDVLKDRLETGLNRLKDKQTDHNHPRPDKI